MHVRREIIQLSLGGMDSKVDLRLSLMKPLHALWILSVFDKLKVKTDVETSRADRFHQRCAWLDDVKNIIFTRMFSCS